MYTIHIQPGDREFQVEEGENLLYVLQKHSIFPVEALCGGVGTCGKCKVELLHPPTPLEREREFLSREEIERGIRLACQQEIRESTTIRIPKEVRREILTTGYTREDAEATLETLQFQVDRKREGTSLHQDLREFLVAEGMGEAQIPIYILKSVSSSFKEKRPLPLLVDKDRVFEVGEGPALGIAFDIGTTTVAGYLLDLKNGEELSVTSSLNPQTSYGGDVISRIQFAMEGEEQLAQISNAIRQTLGDMVEDLLEHEQEGDLLHITMVGNTCMHHLFWGLNPFSLGHAPYRPVVRHSLKANGSILNPSFGEKVLITFLPNIAGYVGSDTIGAILATDMINSSQLSLLIDIGTNGEVVLGNKEALLSCSTAAGPAFEGARITQGMMAEEGAISRVEIREDVEIRVIGDTIPKGICGSGLIEAVGELLRVGLITPDGRLKKREDLSTSLSPALRERVREGEETYFLLDERGGVYLTQGDIRQLQLAKAAIQAGVEVLIEEMGVEAEEIENIYLAGAFGNHIHKGQARRLGLLPDIPLERVHSVGNAAGEGAKLALMSQHFRQEAQIINESVSYIELARHQKFMEYYTDAMFFG